ncbi:MAG TPA: aromatic amino acid transport family protein [Gammaproteobacteria bacterium]|jgi:tyrosine-specific transport protein|nr:aromatic amino acid transport family protein [Gammaproteobacteria bacterium]
MNSKFLGGVLLIIGTTIGAGILALPIATAELGFIGSTILLITIWAIMLACGFLFLEVNLWLPANSNLISMAGATLGKPGQLLTWGVYLLLLYSILSAYIAGGGDLFQYLLSTVNIHISISAASIIVTFLLSLVVCFGIRSVDYVNRGLMMGKLGVLVLLVILIAPFVSGDNVLRGEMTHITSPNSISIVTLAFSSLMIIPSLRGYFDNNVALLRKAIFIGMTVPLVCYIAWDMVILGVIPLEGTPGLKQMVNSPNSTSDLIIALSTLLKQDVINILAKFFTSVCMATSFLSVSLSLSDFLSDGLKMPKKGKTGVVVFAATFLPPIAVVLFYPDAFMRGLSYAGVCCFILMILLPPLMVWRGRYHRALLDVYYQVRGGKPLLAFLLLFATLMIGFGVRTTI